ncbi:hypothetical protein CBG25_09865 [Arsenophonus sp. ENCA]|uniref:hypothetical protein n=1 Tax=Arsenophonus sp. ENCA TaxID=1987579 RepID=UPI000BC8E4D2|nr:hypothetical protein CBG25_09865 [Arsenophonus sp. ENCA]
MGRKRKNSADNWLPPRVSRGKSAFEFRPRSGGTVRLCSFNATPAQVWAAYEAYNSNRSNESLFEGLIERFFTSGDFMELASETQKDYRKYSQKVIAVFGKVNSDDIKPEHIRRYMDKRGSRVSHRHIKF